MIVFTISASATTVRILHSRQVRYKNDKSVEQALNELYEKADQLFAYHVGDEISVNGINFYVIADSGATQDYVVALKKELLSSSVFYIGDTCNSSVVSGCVSDYNLSNVKNVVDNWVVDNFQSNQLKEINGYKGRLIYIAEYESIKDGNNWVYQSGASNGYWTMRTVNGSRWRTSIITIRNTIIEREQYSTMGVRPVINVYKSAITKVNNN